MDQDLEYKPYFELPPPESDVVIKDADGQIIGRKTVRHMTLEEAKKLYPK